MGSNGSHGPRPYTQRQASTVFLRVPTTDWVAITKGLKTEFRASPNAITQALALDPPTPVVAYRAPQGQPRDDRDRTLMVMTETWQEPLGAISPESLEREGHPDMAHFRRYWMTRTRRRFRPLQKVRVFRVRPFEDEDWGLFSERLMTRLYGEFRP